ncbi:hypothetical protein QL285_080318 [Trifolium repens]|nr:hypothetical protein QL285_080318 [Trifolium repens]
MAFSVELSFLQSAPLEPLLPPFRSGSTTTTTSSHGILSLHHHESSLSPPCGAPLFQGFTFLLFMSTILLFSLLQIPDLYLWFHYKDLMVLDLNFSWILLVLLFPCL